MKLVKMSLLAATLIASSAFAIDNTKVAGDAKLFYGTADAGDASLFNKDGAYGQAAAKVGLTTDLTEGVSAGASITALSTLGLEGQLVNGVWEATNGVSDAFWFDEAWIAGTVGKTTGKIGRMELDTPLVFSETWSIATNTFEAAVLINQDIPDTTLVGAYVGGSNGGNISRLLTGKASVISPIDNNSTGTNFHQFYNGAYTVGAINNSWKPLTVQGWYYNATSAANAYWLQADVALDFGLLLGGQYTGLDIKNAALGAPLVDSSNTAYAVMAGYEMKDTFKITAAYSQTGKDDDNGIGAGMNLAASGQSKLYTEAWWNYGYITKNDTAAFNVTVTTPEELTWAGLGLYYTQSTSKDSLTVYDATGANGVVSDLVMSEITLEATKSFGPLDMSLLYIMTNAEDQNSKGDVALAGDPTTTVQTEKGQSYNTIQAYLTYNF